MATEPTSEPRARRFARFAARRAGKPEANLLRELHEQHARALWNYALALTGDADQAREVLHETLLQAWRNPQILDLDRGSQRSRLYAVVRNIVFGEWPTACPRCENGTVRLREQLIADASEQIVNRRLVAAALGRLTQEHRDVLRECFFRGSSVADAARALDIAPDMVKSRAYYALRALRLAIEELRGVE